MIFSNSNSLNGIPKYFEKVIVNHPEIQKILAMYFQFPHMACLLFLCPVIKQEVKLLSYSVSNILSQVNDTDPEFITTPI